MNDEELLRYARQLMMPEIEVAGQEKLLAARVLIVGMGGLGCPAAMYLAAAGVGHLVIADYDTVELSNLQRQIAHGTGDIDRLKVDSAKDTLLELNPGIKVTPISQRLEPEILATEVGAADLVIDGTDNFEARFAINEQCVKSRTRLVSGAAIRLEGQLMVYDPGQSDAPCYRCLYQEGSDDELNCAVNGIAAPVVGTIGTLQAMEALKLIAGFGTSLAGYLLVFDAANMEWRKLKLPRNPDCPTCGKNHSATA
ncbi:MAG: molybdopterin-synthase adenylyltransferase MoeB [Pseudomonadales bacterium]